jgi:RND family efflux transporter MFP subunit
VLALACALMAAAQPSAAQLVRAAQASPSPTTGSPAAQTLARPSATVQGSLPTAAQRAPAAAGGPGGRSAAAPNAVGCMIGPTRVADIGSPVTGIVAQIPVDVGDTVRQGQPLVMLRNDVEAAGERAAHARWSLEAEVRAAEASLELARQRHTRASELLAEGFVSPQAVEQAATELRVAEQRVALSRGQRQVLATDLDVVRAQVNQRTVRAPFDGTIVERWRQPGERVEDRPLLRLAALDPLRVDLIVPAARFGQYKLGDRVQVLPELTGAVAVTAEVTHVDRVIDGASNTYRVRLRLPNPGQRLPAGARCAVEGDASLAGDAAPRPFTRRALP